MTVSSEAYKAKRMFDLGEWKGRHCLLSRFIPQQKNIHQTQLFTQGKISTGGTVFKTKRIKLREAYSKKIKEKSKYFKETRAKAD